MSETKNDRPIQKPVYQTQELENIIAESKIIMHAPDYHYLKFDIHDTLPDCFMISRDKDEQTAVMTDDQASGYPEKEMVGPFRLLEVLVSKPFIAKGFLATITHTISNALINNLVISTFSKDYILVKTDTINDVQTLLSDRGFEIIEEK